MTKLVKFYLVLCWAFLIFISLTAPLPISSEPQEKITFFDKGVHFILFGVFVWLIIWTGRGFNPAPFERGVKSCSKDLFPLLNPHDKRIEYFKRCGINFKVLALASFIISFIYAVFCEYFQIFVPGRDLSEFDLVAGSLGMLSAIIVTFFVFDQTKPKLLLYICCAGCGAYVSQALKKDYEVTLYFYNPNIYPESEYNRRLEEAEKISKKFNVKLIAEKYDHGSWLDKIKGREKDEERGERCRICYQDRLENTAKIAREKGFACFTTTLTISPHKDAKIISEIGRGMGKKYKIRFLDKDFKKQDGFKKSACLCKELGLYRQNYCGCEFSREHKNTRLPQPPPALRPSENYLYLISTSL